jgi:hypothetical protein
VDRQEPSGRQDAQLTSAESDAEAAVREAAAFCVPVGGAARQRPGAFSFFAKNAVAEQGCQALKGNINHFL